jgi:hypothetical protein
MELVDRAANPYSSTFASEVVTCCLADGTLLRLLCKYGGSSGNDAFGHHGGVSYEGKIYRHALSAAGSFTPAFYGTFIDDRQEIECLVVEYLDGALRLNRTPDAYDATISAARHLGEFHAATEGGDGEMAGVLNSYDAEYYRGWARRTAAFSAESQQSFPWLATLCARYEEIVGLLLSIPQVVAHGECYPMNILVRAGAVFLIDWESAALAPGEVDLAALTEGWEPDVVLACEREYGRARWSNSLASNFDRRMWAARLYWGFRWLGDRPGWTAGRGARAHFNQLRMAGEHLGLI